ncbi:hypothetical protein [Gilvimarinus sp. 1_MG-2023]|uniref:hypothetical protein n=1 Tax=Gilvimarinus sp. 1_MG-2023 TaxID=3062638 RepID=UPI0026E446B7|nr:hypothetical protein [Gilvimarinus sp. 1_MG-2023]MDO6747181.1 hypothetical protein [Gilvimarinus sp. 1_MG-2023]
MARYRKVDPRIWNDAKFREISDDAKLVFFMLLTHPNMTALGAMRSTVSGLAEELGWETEAFRKAFQEVLSKGMAEHDQKACLIALPKFIRYNPPESPNVVKAWEQALDLLPECELKTRVIAGARDFIEGKSKGFKEALPEAFAKSMPKSMPYQEQEQEQDRNRNINISTRGISEFDVSRFDPKNHGSGEFTDYDLDAPLNQITQEFLLYHREVGTVANFDHWTRLYRGWVQRRALPPKVTEQAHD